MQIISQELYHVKGIKIPSTEMFHKTKKVHEGQQIEMRMFVIFFLVNDMRLYLKKKAQEDIVP